jgi:cytoskeletal protein CcmA (bactofilin family)
MASSYVNDLRLNEMATGDASGTWGTTTNTNLELIGEALGYGTEGITTNADTHTTTVADGATDPGRAMYIEYTGTLDSACTITIAPNTLNRMHFIENGTSGSQNIIIKQGSGATITIPPGDIKAVYLDGAGSGAAVVDAFASLNVVDLKVQDDLTVTDDVIIGGDIDLEGSIDVNGTANLDIVDIDGAVNMATTALVTGVLTTTAATVFNGGFASNADSTMGTDNKILFRDAAIHISSSADGQLDLVADTEIQIVATTIDIDGAINASGEIIAASLDISGAIDVDGTANLDVVDIDGAVDMASTLAVAGVATAATSANITEGALADGTTAWDAAAKANATLVLEENTTISAPSNAVAGAIISIEVAQHATSGPYTLAWNTVFEFASSTAPVMTATDAKTDIFSFRYNGSVWQEIGRSQNMAQT